MFQDWTTFRNSVPPFFGVSKLWDYLRGQYDSHVGKIRYVKTTVAYTDLATAGVKTLFTPGTDETWAVRGLSIGPGALTNFHSGGDRLLDIKSDTNIFSRIPNASLETLVAASWGATALPYPATPAHGDALLTPAAPLVAAYQGGTTDHSAGSITIQAVLERIS